MKLEWETIIIVGGGAVMETARNKSSTAFSVMGTRFVELKIASRNRLPCSPEEASGSGARKKYPLALIMISIKI